MLYLQHCLATMTKSVAAYVATAYAFTGVQLGECSSTAKCHKEIHEWRNSYKLATLSRFGRWSHYYMHELEALSLCQQQVITQVVCNEASKDLQLRHQQVIIWASCNQAFKCMRSSGRSSSNQQHRMTELALEQPATSSSAILLRCYSSDKQPQQKR